MPQLIASINSVTGPLTLLAFLAVVVLEIYRRSVNDKKGLDYIYRLFKEKLTRNQFYDLSKVIINRIFWIVIIVFGLLVLAFIISTIIPSGLS
ncbi:MAG: hypothetical protein GYA17_07010 [Chloroflexi bacterium]|nr:hypothetical protein [Anaerolineaceae bacterium]NMB88091.1 hypothetical protein [Chloroflexota bacterium]